MVNSRRLGTFTYHQRCAGKLNWLELFLENSKSQLIPKENFGVFKSIKEATNYILGFSALAFKMGQINKQKMPI